EVVTREAGAELVDRTEGPATEPPGHEMAPPSFLSCAYPIPLRIAIRFGIGGCVPRGSPHSPSFALSRGHRGFAVQRCAPPRLARAGRASGPSLLCAAFAFEGGVRVNCGLFP